MFFIRITSTESVTKYKKMQSGSVSNDSKSNACRADG